MQRGGEQIVRRRDFRDLPEMQNHHAIADMPHHREVVRDEQIRQAKAFPQVDHQVHDLRLDVDVQRGDRLVGDDEVGLHRQSARDGNPLPLPAGEFVRIAADRRRAETDQAEQLTHAAACFRLVAGQSVIAQRLRQDRVDGHARIKAGIRVLKDHLQPAADRTHHGGRRVGDLHAIETDAAAVRLVKPNQGAGESGLAAT